jgi:hypothetical protein
MGYYNVFTLGLHKQLQQTVGLKGYINRIRSLNKNLTKHCLMNWTESKKDKNLEEWAQNK